MNHQIKQRARELFKKNKKPILKMFLLYLSISLVQILLITCFSLIGKKDLAEILFAGDSNPAKIIIMGVAAFLVTPVYFMLFSKVLNSKNDEISFSLKEVKSYFRGVQAKNWMPVAGISAILTCAMQSLMWLMRSYSSSNHTFLFGMLLLVFLIVCLSMITDISLFFLATRNSWKESIKKSVFFINNYLKEIILFLLSFLLWALAETLIPLLPAPFLFEYPEVLSVKIVAALLSNLLTYGILIYLWPYYNISKALFWKKMVQEGPEKKYNNKFQTTGSTIVVAGISICLCCLFLVNVGKDVYKGFGESQMKKYSQPIEFSMENPVSLRSPGSLSNQSACKVGDDWIVSYLTKGAYKWPHALALIRDGKYTNLTFDDDIDCVMVSGDYIYYMNGRSLIQYDYRTQHKAKVLDDIMCYYVEGDSVFFTSWKVALEERIIKYDLNTKQIVSKTEDLDLLGNFTVIDEDIYVRNKNHQIVIVSKYCEFLSLDSRLSQKGNISTLEKEWGIFYTDLGNKRLDLHYYFIKDDAAELFASNEYCSCVTYIDDYIYSVDTRRITKYSSKGKKMEYVEHPIEVPYYHYHFNYWTNYDGKIQLFDNAPIKEKNTLSYCEFDPQTFQLQYITVDPVEA